MLLTVTVLPAGALPMENWMYSWASESAVTSQVSVCVPVDAWRPYSAAFPPLPACFSSHWPLL